MIKIGIDCAPGMARPNTWLPGVLKILNLQYEGNPISMLFGAWIWHIPCEDKNLINKKDAELRTYFEDLVSRGRIRGAEWDWEDK